MQGRPVRTRFSVSVEPSPWSTGGPETFLAVPPAEPDLSALERRPLMSGPTS